MGKDKPTKKEKENLLLLGFNFYLKKILEIFLGWLFLITLLLGRWRLMLVEVMIYFIICLISAMLQADDKEK